MAVLLFESIVVEAGKAEVGEAKHAHLRRCDGAESDRSWQGFRSLTIWNTADFVSGSKNGHVFSELLGKAGTGEDPVIYV